MPPKKTTTPMTDAAIKQLIAQGVADALAEHEANKNSISGDDNHDSRSGRRRQVPTTRECTYSDFLKCQPLNFKGIKGVIGLNQWFEKMESVFHISNCTVACQIKFATCTLLGSALAWWNSHIKTVGHDAAYGMPWKTLKKMMTTKYCPRSEIKKLDIKIHNLKVKGTDVVAIEFATEIIDQKIRTFADRQAEIKRKLDDNSRINQTQQQPYKRQNVSRAYTTGSGEKKENTVGNGGAPTRAYAVGNIGKKPNSNVVMGTDEVGADLRSRTLKQTSNGTPEIAGRLKDGSGPDSVASVLIKTLGQANGVMSYFQLGEKGAATTSKVPFGVKLPEPLALLSNLHLAKHFFKSFEGYGDGPLTELPEEACDIKADGPPMELPKVAYDSKGNPQMDLQDQGVIDSGCSRHMTGNMSYLTDYEEIDGGYVAFGGNPKGGKITGKARTPQQNGVAKRRNKILIEVAKTMLANSKLPTTFWVEAVNTACYVQNRVFVVKPHNKTSYELFYGRTPTLSFMRPFGCPVTILNTIDHLGKFDGKADEDWLFDIDALTRTMNYEPIVAGTQSNGFAGTKASDNASQARKEIETVKDYILLPLWTADPPFSQDSKSSHDDRSKPSSDDGKKVDEDPRKDSECNDQEKEDNVNNTNNVNAASINKVNIVSGKTSIELPVDLNMPALEDYSIFDFTRDDEDDGVVADMNNLDTTIQVSHILTTRIHKDHPLDQVIRDLHTQTRKMSKNVKEYGYISTIQQRTNHKDLQNYLFACFLSQEEPKKVIHALKDPRWIEVMQEELLQFKLQEVWTLVDLPNGKRAIGSKWVFRNKKDERGIVIRNKTRLVAQGYTQEEGIDYDEVFAPVARIKAIRLFLTYASFNDFVVYEIDVKSTFLYGKIEEEVYVCQPPGFEDPDFPDRVYKVEKALYGLHQAPRAWYETLSTYLLDNGFQRGKIDKTLFIKRHKDEFYGRTYILLGLQVQQKKDGIFISQDKYVVEILKKFEFTEVKTANSKASAQG
ncbi:putative ribonuclease H-like domain-containing protein [Tanacetum coccineum]